MIYERLARRASEAREWLSRRLRPLVGEDILAAAAVLIAVFILSGGIALVVSPDLRALFTTQVTGGESPLEFTIFALLDVIAFLSLYGLYRAVGRPSPDVGTAAIGLILLVASVAAMLYLLHLKVPWV